MSDGGFAMQNLTMNGSYRYSKEVSAVAERSLKPVAVDYITGEVTFSMDEGIFADYINAEHSAIKAAVSKDSDFPFDLETFKKYCNTLVVSRIAWVTGKSNLLIVRPEDGTTCPALLAQVMMNIGRVADDSLGIQLEPAFAEDEQKVKDGCLSKEEMAKISYYLRRIEKYVGAQGYLKDKSGSWEFMTMQLVDNQIRAPRNAAHPAYSLLAAVTGNKTLVSALSPRVKYGDMDVFKSLVWQLTSI